MTHKRKIPLTMAVVITAIFCFAWINPIPIKHQDTITFEDRVRYQKLIEDLRWSYTSWPEQNTKAKPSRDEILSDLHIRDKVRNFIKMEKALYGLYSIKIDDKAIQNELNRITETTRAPGRLKKMFHLLENDPAIIVECLIRPILVKRLLKKAFKERQNPFSTHPKTIASQSFLPVKSFSTWWRTESENWNGIQEKHSPSIDWTVPEISADNSIPLASLASEVEAETWNIYSSAPSARVGHTAVWTGSELIVWGGNQQIDQYSVNSGARYDPAIDSWSSVSMDFGFRMDSREDHTAVWTGTEMIVWGGGQDGLGSVQGGGLYNPATDSWREMSNTNAPLPRNLHSAIWTGEKMIVWGGYDFNYYESVNTGGVYSPSSDSWAAVDTTNAPTDRQGHTAIWTGSEMIIWGGYDQSADYGDIPYFDDGKKYNPGDDTWTNISSTGAPSPRDRHTAIWTGNAMVVWGGLYSYQGPPNYFNDGATYNPTTDSWSTLAQTNSPEGRRSHTAVWTGDEMIIWGGFNENYLGNGAKYNTNSATWSPISASGAPSARQMHIGVWTGEEMIIWGGRDQTEKLDSGGRYSPVNDTWSSTSNPWFLDARRNHHALWTGNEMIVWGGNLNSTILNTGGRYDPNLNIWTEIDSEYAPLIPASTAVWTGVEMIIWGGGSGFPEVVNTGSKYNPLTDIWTETSTTDAPTGRIHHSAVWTGDKMIVWGGYREGFYITTGGQYDPINDTWVPTSTTNAPESRYSQSTVWTGEEMIVWGGNHWTGSETIELNSGGRYNPITDNWQAVQTAGAPTARSEHSAVWTGTEMIIWGGGTATGGRYNPTDDSWLGVSTTSAPDAIIGFSAIWSGRHMLVWGGKDGDSNTLNSGALYDPQSDIWSPMAQLGAPAGSDDHTAVWTGNEMIVWGLSQNNNDTCIYYPYSLHSVGGSVSGLDLSESIVLDNNGIEQLTIPEDGEFVFAELIPSGGSYLITISEQPTDNHRYCAATNSSGIIQGEDITNIQVSCITISLADIIRALQVCSGEQLDSPVVSDLLSISSEGKIAIPLALKIMNRINEE